MDCCELTGVTAGLECLIWDGWPDAVILAIFVGCIVCYGICK